jgi:hypothetical protein
MKFVLLQSLLQDACSQKVSKSLNIKWDQLTLPETSLVTLGRFNRLGDKESVKNLQNAQLGFNLDLG